MLHSKPIDYSYQHINEDREYNQTIQSNDPDCLPKHLIPSLWVLDPGPFLILNDFVLLKEGMIQ